MRKLTAQKYFYVTGIIGMNRLKTVKKIIYSACVYFTVAVFVILGIATFAKLAGSASFLSLGSMALLFVACLIMSALNLVWKLDYSITVRTLLHFLGSFFTYAIAFIVIPKAYTNAGQVAVRSIVFIVLYLVIAFTVMLISSIRRNRRSDNMEYQSQFDNFFDK